MSFIRLSSGLPRCFKCLKTAPLHFKIAQSSLNNSKSGVKGSTVVDPTIIDPCFLQLCCFGAVGLTFWLYSAVLITSWAVHTHGSNDYFNWLSAKHYFRCLTAFHLIYTFMQTNIENMTAKNFVRNKNNHFLIGCLGSWCILWVSWDCAAPVYWTNRDEIQVGTKSPCTSWSLYQLFVGPYWYICIQWPEKVTCIRKPLYNTKNYHISN